MLPAPYAAPGLRHESLHAFLPAIVSTSGRIHGELCDKLLRLLFILADKKTTLSFQAMGEAVDVDSAFYCWRRSGKFWRMHSPPAMSGAPLCLSTIFRFWVLLCAPTACSLLFSFLFLCSFCLCV